MDSVALKREAISAVLFLDDYGPTTSVFINANRCNHSIGLNTLQNLTLRLKIERTDFFLVNQVLSPKGFVNFFLIIENLHKEVLNKSHQIITASVQKRS